MAYHHCLQESALAAHWNEEVVLGLPPSYMRCGHLSPSDERLLSLHLQLECHWCLFLVVPLMLGTSIQWFGRKAEATSLSGHGLKVKFTQFLPFPDGSWILGYSDLFYVKMHNLAWERN